MATDHAFFYPFPLANCNVKEIDPKTKLAKSLNFVAQMMRDPKTIIAFTTDAYLINPVRNGNSISWSEAAKVDAHKDWLANLNVKTTLYVCGHSGEGLDTISSPDETVKLKVSDLVAYLQNLPKTWSGRLKCFGCETANTSGFWFWASQSFAKRVFDELHKTHPRVEVYGYTHSIATWPTTDPKTGESHKYIDGVRTSQYLQKIQ